MTPRWAALTLLLLAPAPAQALFGWRKPAAHLTAERDAYQSGRFADVVGLLTAEKLQRLRKADRREGYKILAESYERLGALDKALGVYQLAVRLFPEDLPLMTQLGFLLHRSGLHEQARPLFERVLVIHPNNAAAQIGQAEIAARLGFLDRSAEFYERALESQASRGEIWRDYAEVLLKRRDIKTALLACERALSLAREPEALVVHAQALRADGRMHEALARLDEALSFGPAWPRAEAARLLKALWLVDVGRYDEAQALAEAALARDDKDPLAFWIRARVGLKRDRYGAAVRDLESAASAGKRAPFVALAAASLLEKLRASR